ncbi:auxin-responsive protein SAUR32-like [Oryza brachyantha]|uniref:Auxin-responsive protein SAUR32 n=1 Tax=Oryza brachyantha TaxID=4533 RepID=J3LEW7_ORYBR|nr:auxin-responsive protein SAUR32-like [Oryza brachyantha]
MKASGGKSKRLQLQEAAAGGHLGHAAPCRHHDAAAQGVKGCAAFLVGEEGEVLQQHFAVPVALLGHPAILELLAEAREEYGYTHDGAVAVPCSAERFRRAVDAARREDGRRHHHHHFRLPGLAGCFRPSHAVA